MAHDERRNENRTPVKLLFVGSPLLDIADHCSPEVIDQYGLKLGDCVKATDKHEVLFQSLLDKPGSQLTAGGSSQNTARIAQWVLGERGRVSFTGCVGKDEFADRMSSRLCAEGVESLYIPLDGESTGVCACLLNSEGERSMCARLGAAARYSRYHLFGDDVRQKLAEADCVFVEGYFFAHSPDVVYALAETFSEHQVFSLSLSAEYICRDYVQPFLSVLHRVDVLLSNEAEARAVAQALGMPDSTTVEDIARILATQNRPASSKPRIVLVTRGSESVLMVQGSSEPSVHPVPAGVRVKDTVGCGDAMAGAFLAVYTLTGDVTKAVATGILAAVEIVQVSGCNPTQKVLYPENGGETDQSSHETCS